MYFVANNKISRNGVDSQNPEAVKKIMSVRKHRKAGVMVLLTT